jgi:hypothetical protein
MSTMDVDTSLVHCQRPSLRGSAEPPVCLSQYRWTMLSTPRPLDGPSRTGPALRVGVGVTDGVTLGEAEGVTDGVALGEAEGVTDGVALGEAEELGSVAEVGGADSSGRLLGSLYASVGVVAADAGSPCSGGGPDSHMNARAQSGAPTASPPTTSQSRRRLPGLGRASSSRLRLLRGRRSSPVSGTRASDSSWRCSMLPA